MTMRKQTTMAVAATLAVAALVFAVNETSLRVPTGKAVRTCLEVIKAATSDLTLKKCSGKYKYKDDSLYEAEQSMTLVGQCPTAFTRFDQFYNIEFVAHNVEQGIDVNHRFYDPTGVGKDGTSYKQKFLVWSYVKSGDHRTKSYGMFKGKIKDGTLKFTYTITKASELDMLVTNDFEDVHNTMSSTNKPVKDTFDVEGAITLGMEPTYEAHSTSGGVAYTAKKGAAAGKLAP